MFKEYQQCSIIYKGVVIVNAGYLGERDLHRVPKPVVTFYWAIKTFFSYLLGHQNFFPQILKSTGY